MFLAIYPPFDKAMFSPSPFSKRASSLDFHCQGNKEAYLALYLQYFIIANLEDQSLSKQIVRLDPEQDFLYSLHVSEQLVDPGIMSRCLEPYAWVIAEIRVLSLNTTMLPGAPRAWVKAVFNARPLLPTREETSIRLFTYNSADDIR